MVRMEAREICKATFVLAAGLNLGVAFSCALDATGTGSPVVSSGGSSAGNGGSTGGSGANGGTAGAGGSGGHGTGAGGTSTGGTGGVGGGTAGTGGTGGGEPVLPSDVPNLILWLRADLVTQAGGFVSEWADQSATGAHASQSTSSFRPAFISSAPALGAQPALDFDGIDDALIHAPGAVTSPSLNHTFFAVVDSDTTGQLYRWLWECGSGRLGFYFSHGTHHGIFEGVGSIDVTGSTTTTGGTFITWRVESGPQTLEVWEKGVSVGTAAGYAGTTLGGAAAVGAQYTGTPFHFDGRIAEIILYDRGLTSVELAQIHAYLQLRYQL